MRAFALIPTIFGLGSLADQLISRSFPHLIVPVNKLLHDTPITTQETVDIERDIYTEISFDVPVNGASWCSLDFNLNVDPKFNVPWKLWGAEPYVFNVSTITRAIDKDKDTWDNRPQPKDWVATFEVFSSGQSKVDRALGFACAPGQVQQYLLHPADLAREGGLTWFELEFPLHGITYDMFGP